MCPGKENIITSLNTERIEFCSDNDDNNKREVIDCVVSYAKMLEVIRDAQKVIFIGYSFPQMDYETITLLNLAFEHSVNIECHICIKDTEISKTNICCRKVIYYKDGLEQFLVTEFRGHST